MAPFREPITFIMGRKTTMFRRSTYHFVCLALGLFFLTAAVPHIPVAQEGVSDSVPVPVPAPPSMRYTPPSTAQSMAELYGQHRPHK